MRCTDIGRRQKYRAAAIYVIFVALMIGTIRQKANMHIDDLFSYSLANHVGALTISFQEGYTYSPVEKLYLDGLAVDREKGRFCLENVWKNQSMDVHPPLYYLLLHMVCSCFPGVFSVWFAGGLNIFFAVFTLFVWRKMMCLFLPEPGESLDFFSLLFILTTGILQNVSFFRMYVMAMFFVTLTAWMFLRLLEEGTSWWRGIALCVVSIAGALTHYYCIVYLFFICVVYGVFLLAEKRWKDIVTLFLCMGVAAFDSVRMFPAMTYHMFSGYRGAESIQNLTHLSKEGYLERLRQFGAFLNKQLFGQWGWAAVAALFLLWCGTVLIRIMRNEKSGHAIAVFYRKKADGSGEGKAVKGEEPKFWQEDMISGQEVADIQSDTAILAGQTHDEVEKFLLVGIPAFLYFLFVSKTASYVTDRYLFPIYAVMLGLFFHMLVCLAKKIPFFKKPFLAVGVLCGLLTANGWKQAEWDYLYRHSSQFLAKAQEYADANCICIYDGVKWKVQNMFYEASQYKSMTILHEENMEEIAWYQELLGDGFILCAAGVDGEWALQETLKHFPAYSHVERVGGFAESVTYYVYRDKE